MAILLILEIAIRFNVIDNSYFPPPSLVIGRCAELLTDALFLRDVGTTAWATVVGLAVAMLISIPLGIIMGSSRIAYAASRGIVELLRPIPSVALIPLAILLYGGGLNMKVSLIVYASVWPILFNAIYGAHDVEPLAKDTARSFGVNRLGTLWKVTLPHAAPFIATGVRVSAAIALVLAISAEFLAGGSGGLGSWMLKVSSVSGETGLIFAGITIAGLMGLALNGLLALVERRLFPWHHLMQEKNK
ncbi:ABC transporter permease [Arthrobacter sp. SLBN-100]|uniref:ABC transporter permease n=1 Tax=Arthrobacter sp. SLBN-100 TaxID=2768450 RepID=UPI00135B5CC5|nr:ABC transporter permease subunit [Arthrobacter sp. SLBN-100]